MDQDFGDIAIDVISVIREGNISALKSWLSDYKNADKETQDQKKSEIYGESSWGSNMSGLIWALDLPDKEVAKELLDLILAVFPDLVNIGDSEKSTPLHYASLNGDTNLIKYLFSKGAKILLDNNEENPLHSAALNGHYEATKILLKRGVDPNHQNINGCTPLHNAVMNNQHKVINLLVSHPNINIGLKNNEGQTAQNLAQTKNNIELVAIFSQEKNENLVEIFDLEDEISQLQERIQYLNELSEEKKNETHQIYKKLVEIETLHEAAKRQEEQLLASSGTKKPNYIQTLINDTKNEIEREEHLTILLQNRQDNLSNQLTNEEQNQQALDNLYNNLVSTTKLFEAIKTGLNDSKYPLNSLCKTIKPDHNLSVFELQNEQNKEIEMEETDKPKLAGFLIT